MSPSPDYASILNAMPYDKEILEVAKNQQVLPSEIFRQLQGLSEAKLSASLTQGSKSVLEKIEGRLNGIAAQKASLAEEEQRYLEARTLLKQYPDIDRLITVLNRLGV